MNKKGYVYFMTNKYNNVLYVGVTSNLLLRVAEHKAKINKGFTYKYNCNKLVYFEEFEVITDAIAREKQIKNWKREWKNDLICKDNPDWNDLAEIIGVSDEVVEEVSAEIAGQARNDNTDQIE
jgi:putative endonuclease